MTKEQKQSFTFRITQANPTEMVVILYEMLLSYVREGQEALEEGRQAEFQNAIRCARGCIGELMNSLNLKYEPAPALLGIYGYCVRRLTAASVRRNAEPLKEIEKLIAPVMEAYRQIAGQNTAGPVMNHSQTVYAGLTYGRNTLTENMTDQGFNRGMLA